MMKEKGSKRRCFLVSTTCFAAMSCSLLAVCTTLPIHPTNAFVLLPQHSHISCSTHCWLEQPDSSSSNDLISSSSSNTTTSLFDQDTKAISFGDVVPLTKSSQDNQAPVFLPSTTAATPVADPAQRKIRNGVVAVVSILLALLNYAWQYTHPIQPIQLLYEMEQRSSPVTVIGTTNKPTVVDFWAPWCENCREMAATLYKLEDEYGDRVNFVMVNGDDPKAWPLIDAFGVDAIPHLALVESDGTVDTALIGPTPAAWLEQDLNVLVENAAKKDTASEEASAEKQQLPHVQFDAFANRPSGQRRIQVVLPTD